MTVPGSTPSLDNGGAEAMALPVGPGSIRSAHEAPDGSSPSVTIPNAVYATYVFRHKSEADARRVFSAIMRRWPIAEDGKRSRVTAWSADDAMSVSDAVRLTLECRDLDQMERQELALDLLELPGWDACLAKFAEWEMCVDEGALVDARSDEAESGK